MTHDQTKCAEWSCVLFGVSRYNNIIIKTGKLKSTVQRKQSLPIYLLPH